MVQDYKIELCELAQVAKEDAAALKNFLATREDQFRPAYDRDQEVS